jgi:hypothetical protein
MRLENVRSLDLIFSLAEAGTYAKDILQDLGGSSFGQLSSFERFSYYDVLFVNLDISFGNSLT